MKLFRSYEENIENYQLKFQKKSFTFSQGNEKLEK